MGHNAWNASKGKKRFGKCRETIGMPSEISGANDQVWGCDCKLPNP